MGKSVIAAAVSVAVTILLLACFSFLSARSIEQDRATVKTNTPKLGMHTRVTDEVEQWKIEKTFQMVREMGARWAVEYFPWLYMEPRKGSIDWSHADLVVNSAYAQGLNLIARIDAVPDWARPKNTTTRYLDRDHFADYADFVYAFVQRYKSKVHHYVIWNEPNTSFEWGYRPVNPEEYTELLKTAYERAKQADRSAVILAAGLAPTLDKSDMALDDLAFLQGMYDAGARGYFDGLAVHAYGWKLPPDDPPSTDRINFARVELIRAVMVKNGDADKPIFITEAGWNDHPRWTKAVRPAQRIEYTLRAAQKAEDEWPWCEVIAFWNFRLPAPTNTYNDYFTFVSFDFSPKPIYNELRGYATAGSPTAK